MQLCCCKIIITSIERTDEQFYVSCVQYSLHLWYLQPKLHVLSVPDVHECGLPSEATKIRGGIQNKGKHVGVPGGLVYKAPELT